MYRKHELTSGVCVETYHMSSVVFARIVREWLHRTGGQFWQEPGKRKRSSAQGVGIFSSYLLPIIDKFVFDNEAALTLNLRTTR